MIPVESNVMETRKLKIIVDELGTLKNPLIYCERRELFLHVYRENKQDTKSLKIVVERPDWYQNVSFFM